MSSLRVTLTLIVSLAALVLVTAAVRAAPAPMPDISVAPPAARLADIPTQSRTQTITLINSAEVTPSALTTVWEYAWQNRTQMQQIALPADFISLTVAGDSYTLVTNTNPFTTSLGEVFTNVVNITPTAQQAIYLSYRTGSRAYRTGNQYRLVLRAVSSKAVVFSLNILFSNTLQFMSYAHGPYDTVGQSPQVANERVTWGPLTLSSSSDRFDKDIVLADTRLPIDLAIQSFGYTLAPSQTSVRVTATLINDGALETGNPLIVELYNRPHGAGAPSSPTDHQWGACAGAPDCTNYRPPNYYRYTLSLESGQTLPVTFDYAFDAPGQRDLYLQIDSSVNVDGTFGGAFGLNLEGTLGETNNVVFVGTVDARVAMYLPIILKNY